ncbi:MAG: helix-turn-helix domain-containing protein [Burkholderiaceae bacterium]
MTHPLHQIDAHRPTPLAPTRQRLSTTEVPQDQRFEYWLDMICSMYVQLECDRPCDAEFFGNIEFSRIGALDLTRLSSSAPRVRRTLSKIHQGNEDFCLVQLQQAGRGVVFQDDRIAMVEPGDFVMYDCTRPYELIFNEPRHDVVVVRLPRALMESHVGNLRDLTATTVKGGGAAGNLLLSMVDSLQQDIDRLHPASAMGVSEAITNIIAAGLRSLPGANARKTSSLSAYHIARIKAYVIENLRDPSLSVNSIAQAMKVTPDHLSRLFRGEPMPLSRLIWQQRLDACRRDLSDPRCVTRSVSEIAYSWGFNDATHFSRCFKTQFGCSAREWRNQLAQELVKN